MLVALGSGAGSLGTGVLFQVGGMLGVALAGLIFTLALMGLLAWTTLSARTATATSEAPLIP
jgi:hypothetical protein